MNVYVSKCTEQYTDSMVLVAANSPEEALKTIKANHDCTDYFEGDMSEFKLIPGLHYDTDKPKFIDGSSCYDGEKIILFDD